MWTDLRAEIDQACQQLGLSAQDFAPLPFTTDWARLQQRIYHRFCHLDHPTARPIWLLGMLPTRSRGLVCEDEPFAQLTCLVDPAEVVWLMLNETVDDGDKFWFYQGTPRAIGQVLAECCWLDEVSLFSKKYAWLLCLNHHEVLYGVGFPMQAKLLARGA